MLSALDKSLQRRAVFEISRFYPHQTLAVGTTMKVMNIINPSEGCLLTKISKKALAETIGCGVALFFVYPFDLGFALLDNETSLGDNWYIYMLSGMTYTAETKGVRSLWRGFAISMVGLAVSHITYFGLYDVLEPPNPTKSQEFLLRLFANSISVLVTWPIGTIQARQIRTGESPSQITRHISIDSSITGFFRGVSMGILKGAFDVCLFMLLKELQTIGTG